MFQNVSKLFVQIWTAQIIIHKMKIAKINTIYYIDDFELK